MPPKKGNKKKSGMKKRGARRMALSRPLKYNANRIGGINTARVATTRTTTILPNQPYYFTVDGIEGIRPQALAPNFALYRVSRVVIKYKPNYDTYVSNPGFIGGAGPVSVPTLYWKMNRFADMPAVYTADDLKRLGARPIRFDDKQYTHSYKPNILLSRAAGAAGTGGSDSGEVRISPWLNTDLAPMTNNFAPSTTQHWGHFFIVECAVNGAGTTPVGTADITVYYEFKNPRVEWTQSEGLPQMLSVTKQPEVQISTLLE